MRKKIDVKIKTLTLAVNENERISSRGKKNKGNKATRTLVPKRPFIFLQKRKLKVRIITL